MKFPEPLVEGRLIRRYKRFLADVRLPDGSEVTAHCPNTGSMLGCQPENARVWLSRSDNPKRKLQYTWELVETSPGQLACVNTARPNSQAREAVQAGTVVELAGYRECRAEVKYGVEKSRIDLSLSGHVPDAVTERGQKHLRELMAQVQQGDRAVLFFVVNHTGIQTVRPADHIDRKYGELLREACDAGVEVVAYRADLSESDGTPTGVLTLTESVPVILEV